MRNLTVLIPNEGESRTAFLRRLRKASGDILVVLSTAEHLHVDRPEERKKFLDALKKESSRLRLATRLRSLTRDARAMGIRVIDRVPDLRHILAGHDYLDEALRAFSPHAWRQQLRSRLQSMGLLSLPRLRIWILVLTSFSLFIFVVLRLLPAAEIRVVPREDSISQTSNVFLVLSGATVNIPQRVRTMDLQPLRVTMHRSITFDQISKEFIGTSAKVPMTVINKATERYSLRKGSRLVNQAGMIFRIQDSVIIDPGQEVTVMAKADDVDLYDEIIGERGNLPPGVRWNFAGLEQEEQSLVYAENRVESTGGKTVYRTVLQESDLKVAQKILEDELAGIANQLVDEEITLRNSNDTDSVVRRLYYDELTKLTYTGFVLPTEFIGEKVSSIPVEGSIEYIAYGYDAQYALTLLRDELLTHVEDGKKLLDETISLDRLNHVVIDYADDLSWIKLTVDLSGTEQAILDPLMPAGAKFHQRLRELVLGKSKEEAISIVKNLPEVEDVDISLWPPWNQTLPSIPYHITIQSEEG